MIFLMVLGGICQTCTNSNKPDKTISLTQDQLMIIYFHGYTMGAFNQFKNSARPISYDNLWIKDSLFIVNMFKDDFK